MKFVKLILSATSIGTSVALLVLVASAPLIPIYLVDVLYVIGIVGLVGGIGTHILIIKE